MEGLISEEHMQQLDKKIAAIGLPEEYTETMRKEAAAAQKGYFLLFHRTEIDALPVEVALGFQERKEGGKDFQPDLMSVRLESHPQNLVNRNVFYLPTGSDVSIREAVNLMQGRAIYRASEIPGDDNHWMRLDSGKEFHGIRSPYIVKGHLDVAEWLKRSPLNKKVSSEEKAAIVKGLEQGDRYALDREQTGTIYLEASPEKDRVDMKNENGKLIRRSLAADRVRTTGRQR